MQRRSAPVTARAMENVIRQTDSATANAVSAASTVRRWCAPATVRSTALATLRVANASVLRSGREPHAPTWRAREIARSTGDVCRLKWPRRLPLECNSSVSATAASQATTVPFTRATRAARLRMQCAKTASATVCPGSEACYARIRRSSRAVPRDAAITAHAPMMYACVMLVGAVPPAASLNATRSAAQYTVSARAIGVSAWLDGWARYVKSANAWQVVKMLSRSGSIITVRTHRACAMTAIATAPTAGQGLPARRLCRRPGDVLKLGKPGSGVRKRLGGVARKTVATITAHAIRHLALASAKTDTLARPATRLFALAQPSASLTEPSYHVRGTERAAKTASATAI